MPKYIIEREIPGASNFTAEKLRAISQVSCGTLLKMGAEIQWKHSYIAGDKIYCIYIAPDKNMVLQHATESGFPANVITEVTAIIDPVTAE